ncbi:uncharacterized protein LOC119102713 [Pollicipes pollicipes]|uniref:uncharacterized protein LOC119102713 n=1 Tax=Pollicipes pollicipes TaxID=41117 RepID=UPI0018851226|nr:uncharacterized protein LOC119102713 [Pollicipes pollicipes]
MVADRHRLVKLEVEEHELEDPGDRDDLDWEVPTAGENDSSYAGGRSGARHNGPIEVLELPERSEPTPSHNDLTFMELVKIKEAVTKKVDETSAGGPEEHIRRLRMARRQAISWVETRLRSEAQGDITPSSHGKQGKSKYDALITARPTTAAAALTPARAATVSSSRGRGRPLLPKPPMVRLTGARHVTVEGQPPTAVDADDPDYDPTAGDDFDNERARKLSAATRPTRESLAAAADGDDQQPAVSTCCSPIRCGVANTRMKMEGVAELSERVRGQARPPASRRYRSLAGLHVGLRDVKVNETQVFIDAI